MVLRVLLAAAVSLGAVVAVPTSAQAEWQRGCVNRQEYRSVHRGMRMVRVHRIFNTTGRRAQGWDGIGPIREYRACRRLSDGAPGYMVSYRRNERVYGKSHIIMD